MISVSGALSCSVPSCCIPGFNLTVSRTPMRTAPRCSAARPRRAAAGRRRGRRAPPAPPGTKQRRHASWRSAGGGLRGWEGRAGRERPWGGGRARSGRRQQPAAAGAPETCVALVAAGAMAGSSGGRSRQAAGPCQPPPHAQQAAHGRQSRRAGAQACSCAHSVAMDAAPAPPAYHVSRSSVHRLLRGVGGACSPLHWCTGARWRLWQIARQCLRCCRPPPQPPLRRSCLFCRTNPHTPCATRLERRSGSACSAACSTR